MSTTGYMAVASSSASPEWPTPQWVVDQLAAEFGPFDLDPATNGANAKAPRFFTEEEDGLSQPWTGRVWLNPPYGRTIGQWMAKAAAEVDLGHAERVVCLVPARVDTRWWRAAVDRASLVRIWPGRIKWRNDVPAPFANAVIVFGRLPGRHGTEPAWCASCGSVFWPARRDGLTCSPKCRKAVSRMSQITPPSRDKKGSR